ncbi:serine/threonine-protein kinase-like protein ACR4 [Populus alba x Populus x berolinensis]|nr:serine/threonine-protein kinase-like protein ACR4 [Populus alba x Populus x berolinensis]
MKSSQEIAYYFILSLLAAFVVILCLVLILFCRKKPVESEESLPTTLTKKERPWVGFSCQDFCTGVSINRYRRCHRWVNHRRIIGTGRLGTVHAAVLPSDQKPVAVKRTHPSLVLSNACLGLISSMLKTLSLAQHPNVVPILGFSQAPGERNHRDGIYDKLGARVSDYGLSSLGANEKRGLVGYVDDEFWSMEGRSLQGK